MISIVNLTKSYGVRTLFDQFSLTVYRGEKIGLVGNNGAGKSTLFSLILRTLEPSSGRIDYSSNLRIGYLAQEAQFQSNRTVLAELTEGDPTIAKLKEEKHRMELENQAASYAYGEVAHQLEALGYFDLEHKAKKILSGLGFKQTDFERPIKELSGGWQMRTLLARLLTFQYDILLLDEPTNYLDLNAALWFKDYLLSFDGTFIMISHDKSFLDEVTNYTLVLENGVFTKVRGNYEHYRQIQDEKRQYLIKQYKEYQKKEEQLTKFTQRFHAQPNKATQVRAKKKMLDRMAENKPIVPPDYRETIKSFNFPPTKNSGYNVIRLKNISKAYGSLSVYKDFDFEINRGEKAVLAGENGAGKSTLLKLLAGVINPDSGSRVVGHNVEIGYFSQTRLDVLNTENSVLDEAYAVSNGQLSLENLRTVLGAFLFRGDDVEKKVKVLSGGEKSRLILAKLLINPPNFLLLDEPTTHLDVDSVDALIRALTVYEGTIVFISHDIHFVRSLANVVYDVKFGRVRKFPGEFDYYWRKKNSGELEKEEAQFQQRQEVVVVEAVKTVDLVDPAQENEKLAARIRKLRKQKEKLELERYAKQRIVENARHGAETIRYYQQLVQDLDKQIAAIDQKITHIKTKFR